MKQTTLCYLEKDGCYLMLHRVSKKNDENAGKWIGVGGKLEEGESPEECAIREETGIRAESVRLRAVITFVSDLWESEMMYLFTADDFDVTEAALEACDEGNLAWIPIPEVEQLPSWEGDRIFLQRLQETKDCYSLKLVYQGDTLVEAVLWENGVRQILKSEAIGNQKNS